MIWMPLISVLFHLSLFEIMALHVVNTHTTLLFAIRSKTNYVISCNLNNEKNNNAIHNLIIHVYTKFDVHISVLYQVI